MNAKVTLGTLSIALLLAAIGPAQADPGYRERTIHGRDHRAYQTYPDYRESRAPIATRHVARMHDGWRTVVVERPVVREVPRTVYVERPVVVRRPPVREVVVERPVYVERPASVYYDNSYAYPQAAAVDNGSVVGAIGGAILGAVIGNQVTHGQNRAAATAVGAVIGGVLGGGL